MKREEKIKKEYNNIITNNIEVDFKESTRNEKLVNIVSIDYLPEYTCNRSYPCWKHCYARKGAFNYNNVIKRKILNTLDYFKSARKHFNKIDAIVKYNFALGIKHVRFFGSGDIPDAAYMNYVIDLCNMNPGVKFLIYTKKYNIVNSKLNEYVMPKNLTIILSSWLGIVFNNPHNLPVAYLEFEKIPEGVKQYNCDCKKNKNQNHCASCLRCWKLKSNESVVFKLH